MKTQRIIAAVVCLVLVAALIAGLWYVARTWTTNVPALSRGARMNPGRSNLIILRQLPYRGFGLVVLGVVGLLGFGAIVWLAVSLARPTPASVRPPELEPPLDTLKRRYARGEIDREEYERMREELMR